MDETITLEYPPHELLATIELVHPVYPEATLILWVYEAYSEAAWRLGEHVVWQGLPCEA